MAKEGRTPVPESRGIQLSPVHLKLILPPLQTVTGSYFWIFQSISKLFWQGPWAAHSGEENFL